MATKVRVIKEDGATSEFPSIELIPEELKEFPYETIPIVEPTQEEISEAKRPLIESIDNYYTSLISELFEKHKVVEKFISEQLPVPEEILVERNRLRAECNQKISELGVDIDTYRKTKRETIILNEKY